MKKILVADDSMFMRKMLKDLLSKQYEILEADSIDSTLERVKKDRPDLVLLDIVMPEGDEAGVEALGRIKKANPEAKVVMITAVGQDSVMNKCKKLGVDEYLVKPFDEAQVLKTVEKYVA